MYLTRDYDAIVLVFDTYRDDSLKSATSIGTDKQQTAFVSEALFK